VENEGKILILDRYCYSGVAYSMSNGLNHSWCRAPDSGLPKPDLVLFMNLTPEKAAERGGFGEEIYEKLEFQKKVFENFVKLKEDNWAMIEQVSEEVKELATKAWEARDGPLGELWPLE
jgi:dTMP kinase